MSEFVAKFIGAANVLKGEAVDASRVMISGVPVRTTGLTLTLGRPTPVAIRQHDVKLATPSSSALPENTLAGIIRPGRSFSAPAAIIWSGYLITRKSALPRRQINRSHPAPPSGMHLNPPLPRTRGLIRRNPPSFVRM